MAKSNNQKAKILYLERMLLETGEHKTLSMQDILAGLGEHGINAERKSIYDDVEVLRSIGMDIRYTRERPGGYYLYGQGTDQVKLSEERKETQPDSQAVKKNEAEAPTLSGYQQLLACSARNIKKEIRLLCAGAVQDEVRDFFCEDAEYKMKESGDFTVTAELPENAKFYGWLTGMDGSVRILKPKKSALAYRDYLKSLAKEYKGL